MNAAPIMIKITPAQRMDETVPPRNHIGREASRTRSSSAVSGQSKLISRLGMQISAARRKNTASKATPNSMLGLVAPLVDDAYDFGAVMLVHFARFASALFQKHDAGGFEHETHRTQKSKYRYENFVFIATNPGNESVRCRVCSSVPSRADSRARRIHA